MTVAPFTGAWIETPSASHSRGFLKSRPSRARGLKHPVFLMRPTTKRRALHGRVD